MDVTILFLKIDTEHMFLVNTIIKYLKFKFVFLWKK